MTNQTSQIERGSYCQHVLKSRMQDGCLHEGRIHDNVETFTAPAGSIARGCGGGFPCQAACRNSIQLLSEATCSVRGLGFSSSEIKLRGYRKPATRMEWRTGERPSSHTFSVSGTRWTQRGAACCDGCLRFVGVLADRRCFIFLENCAALLGTKDSMQGVMHYLIQDSCHDDVKSCGMLA